MNVNLSKSVDQSFRNALTRADRLRELGETREAAAVYREAAGLVRQLTKYAVSPAEKSRRLKRAEELEAFAEKIVREPLTTPPSAGQARTIHRCHGTSTTDRSPDHQS